MIFNNLFIYENKKIEINSNNKSYFYKFTIGEYHKDEIFLNISLKLCNQILHL